MCGFGGISRGNYFEEESGKAEVEVRVGKLQNGKVTEEMIKGKGDRVVDWIWWLCSMAFESGVVAEDWRSAVIVPLYKD